MRLFPFIEAKDIPAWLQAGAAVVALVLSTWAIMATKRVAVEGRRAAIQEARLRAKIVAAAVVTDLEVAQGEIDRLLRRFHYPQDIGQILRDSDAELFARAGFRLPPMIELSLPRLHWLGEDAGATMVMLVASMLNLDRQLALMRGDLERHGIRNLDGWIYSIRPHLELLSTTLGKAKAEVGELHFGPSGYPS